MAKPSKKIQEVVQEIVFDEYTIGKTNQSDDVTDFESYIDLFDAERVEKEYDWMSDIFLPEFPTHMLTQSAIDVSQYFQTRDFVDVYYEDSDPQGKKSAEATKELLNRTLNRRNLYHYMKYVRGKTLNHLVGHVDLHCWWEQETETEYDVNALGDIIGEAKVPVKDYFCYEVLDPRNVFTDKKYAYSMQEREWVIIRSEKSLSELKAKENVEGYFNLDLLRDEYEAKSDDKTATMQETLESDEGSKMLPSNKMGGKYDILKRYGKFWITENNKGEALPGIDEFGNVKPSAFKAEMVMSVALHKDNPVLIQFHRTPYIDAHGFSYKPVIRGLCYIHPTRDAGVGDGKYSRELQIAINDTFNLSNDRTTLATLPTLKGKKYVTEDTDTVRIAPDHVIELNDPDSDLKELIIKDDITGAMRQLAVLFNKMNQATAIYPTTMGDVPGESSTTATAVAGAEGRTNQRTNYKSMTFEYTALTELYWMIQQMTWTFAMPQTGVELMGDKVFDFNPSLDYTYKPVSASIETEHSKALKIKNWTVLLSYVINLDHPNIVTLVNYIVSKIATLMGDEYADFGKSLLNPNVPIQPQGGNQASAPVAAPTQNQYALAQPPSEQAARAIF